MLVLASESYGYGFHSMVREICITLITWEVQPPDMPAAHRLAGTFLQWRQFHFWALFPESTGILCV